MVIKLKVPYKLEKNVFFSKTYLNTECMYADNIIVDDD